MAEPEERPLEEPGAEGAGEGGRDWKALARMWEKRSKENAEKARAYDELQEMSKADLEKATERADGLQKQLDELNAKSERDALRARVAKATGVPAELIAGDDEDSMMEFAQAVAKYARPASAPRAQRPGRFADDAGEGGDAAKRALAAQMFGSRLDCRPGRHRPKTGSTSAPARPPQRSQMTSCGLPLRSFAFCPALVRDAQLLFEPPGRRHGGILPEHPARALGHSSNAGTMTG